MMLQALQGLHEQGYGIGDIKPDNIRVMVAPDGVTSESCTLLDMGGCVAYSGQICCLDKSTLASSVSNCVEAVQLVDENVVLLLDTTNHLLAILYHD